VREQSNEASKQLNKIKSGSKLYRINETFRETRITIDYNKVRSCQVIACLPEKESRNSVDYIARAVSRFNDPLRQKETYF